MFVVVPLSLSHSLSHVAAVGLGSALKILRLTHLVFLPHHHPSLLGSWFPTELNKMAALLTNTSRVPHLTLKLLQLASRHRGSANHEALTTPCESRRQRGSQAAAPRPDK